MQGKGSMLHEADQMLSQGPGMVSSSCCQAKSWSTFGLLWRILEQPVHGHHGLASKTEQLWRVHGPYPYLTEAS